MGGGWEGAKNEKKRECVFVCFVGACACKREPTRVEVEGGPCVCVHAYSLTYTVSFACIYFHSHIRLHAQSSS